ncbi:hypothetical protein ACTXKH_03390 [Brachybacterium tyrofermentans]
MDGTAVQLDAEAGLAVHRLGTEGRPQAVALLMGALLSWIE